MHIDTGVAVFLFRNKKYLTDPSKIIVAPGYWEEFVLARDSGNIIIPIGSNGFMARNIFDEIKSNVDKYKYLENYMEVLANEHDADKLVEVVTAIAKEQCIHNKKKKLRGVKMAHKTFISYKYSESKDLRDKIIKVLGKDAKYYKGENVDSKDMTDFNRKTIEKNLSDMMYDTSVTIVILSPKMRESDWIGWEISYCLKKTTREGRTSQRNGVVAVIKKVNGSYSWFKYLEDGAIKYHMEKIHDIIAKNHFNSKPPIKTSSDLYDWLKGSYISFIEEEDFLSHFHKYIDNAYDKSENDGKGYQITVTE